MVRAAAKNFKNVSIITNRDDYKSLIKELETFRGKTSLKFRELMSSKAFGLTAYYDAMISIWFNKKLRQLLNQDCILAIAFITNFSVCLPPVSSALFLEVSFKYCH